MNCWKSQLAEGEDKRLAKAQGGRLANSKGGRRAKDGLAAKGGLKPCFRLLIAAFFALALLGLIGCTSNTNEATNPGATGNQGNSAPTGDNSNPSSSTPDTSTSTDNQGSPTDNSSTTTSPSDSTNSTGTEAADITYISPDDLKAMIDAGDTLLVIDTRSYGLFASGHIPGSMSIPLSRITIRAAEIPKDRPIILVTKDDTQDQDAWANTLAAGVDASQLSVLEGGMGDWQLKGYGFAISSGSGC